MIDDALVARAEAWMADDPDPATRAEVAALLHAGDRAGLVARFGGRLQFGTAGLRGPLGAGPLRMNRAIVRRAAAGIGRWLLDHSPGSAERGVVIGFDARHGSADFAADSAGVLARLRPRALVLPRPLPTPILASAILEVEAAAGIMVTASHNPRRDNGYKVYLGDASQIIPPADAEISAAIDAVGLLADVPRGKGWQVAGDELVAAYVAAVAGQSLTPERDLRLAYTPMHGVG